MAHIQEVDLHTNAFMRNTSGLTTEDLVQSSLQRMRIFLERAIDGKQKQIRFIHGVGAGTLKDRVYHELRVYEQKGLIESFEPSFFNKGVVIVNIRF